MLNYLAVQTYFLYVISSSTSHTKISVLRNHGILACFLFSTLFYEPILMKIYMKPNIMKTHIILILGLGRGGEATDLFLSHRTAILRYNIKLKGLICVRSSLSNELFFFYILFVYQKALLRTFQTSFLTT